MGKKLIRSSKLALITALVGVAALPLWLAQKAGAFENGGKYFIYIGTYTGPSSKGIYALRFDAKDGSFGKVDLAGEIQNPSFLALHPSQKYLYAVSELGSNGRGTASVSSFSIDHTTGKLNLLNTVSTGGGGACHLVVDKTQKMLLVANYGTGSVATFAVKPDGRLSDLVTLKQHSGSSVNPRRQRGPHAHAVVLSADNQFVFVPDLGLDEIFAYRIHPSDASLTANEPPYVKVAAGSGPRHFALHPSNRFAYDLNEMGSSVTAFSYDAGRGALNELQTISTLPEDFTGTDNSAEIAIDRSGKFLYASNRGHDSITAFVIDPKKGTLTKLQVTPTQGKTPRNFVIDPSGRFLLVANQDSNNVVLFRIDRKTGKINPTGSTVEVPSPVCLQFVPAT